MALNFPFEAYLQAAQAKNQNRRQAMQDLSGIGQSIGQGMSNIADTINNYKQEKAKQKLVELLAKSSQPTPNNLGPNAGSVVPNFMQQANPYLMQIDPQGVISSLMTSNDPYKQSEIAKNNAMTNLYNKRVDTLGQPGAAKQTIYEDPTGQQSPSLTPVEGWIPMQVSPAQALQYTSTPRSAKDRNAAMGQRAEVWNRSIDARQIDAMAKASGLDKTVVRGLQQNNIRANRALDILNDPSATWQALNGWVSTDFAGIMQGGAPQKDQILESQFPNWRSQLAQLQTYAGSQPKGTVPAGFRNYMRNFIVNIQKLDNQYLKDATDYQVKMLAPTIRGGGQFGQMSQDYMNKFMNQQPPTQSAPSSGGWSIQRVD